VKLLSGNGLLIAGNVKDLTARCACATPNTQRQFHRGLPNVASRGITAHGSPSLPGLGSGPGPGSVSVAKKHAVQSPDADASKKHGTLALQWIKSFAFWWFPYPLVNVNKKLWKDPPFSMGKSTISMVIFNSYVKLPEGMGFFRVWPCLEFGAAKPEHKPSDPRRWATASLWRTFRYGSRRIWVRHSHPRAKCSANC